GPDDRADGRAGRGDRAAPALRGAPRVGVRQQDRPGPVAEGLRRHGLTVGRGLIPGVSRASEESNRRLLRARDEMDRSYASPLDVPTLARIACVSEAHFIRTFRDAFGETPNRYLQRRRV